MNEATFCLSQRCPLFTGLTVYSIMSKNQDRSQLRINRDILRENMLRNLDIFAMIIHF